VWRQGPVPEAGMDQSLTRMVLYGTVWYTATWLPVPRLPTRELARCRGMHSRRPFPESPCLPAKAQPES